MYRELRWWEHAFEYSEEVPALRVRIIKGLKWRILYPLASFIIDFLNRLLDLVFWFVKAPDDTFWNK